jgi:hypothetical protein
MLWILLTAAAAPLQVARNALQRGLVGDAGPWGATLVRFLFGLPFLDRHVRGGGALTPDAHPDPVGAVLGGGGHRRRRPDGGDRLPALTMHRSGFAVATVMQQSSLPLAAVIGLAWATTLPAAGLGRRGAGHRRAGDPVLAEARQTCRAAWRARCGLASGLAFAVALNGYRQAGSRFDHAIRSIRRSPAWSAPRPSSRCCWAAILAALARVAARRGAVVASSLGAGFFGSAASACWFGPWRWRRPARSAPSASSRRRSPRRWGGGCSWRNSACASGSGAC